MLRIFRILELISTWIEKIEETSDLILFREHQRKNVLYQYQRIRRNDTRIDGKHFIKTQGKKAEA